MRLYRSIAMLVVLILSTLQAPSVAQEPDDAIEFTEEVEEEFEEGEEE